MDVNDNACLLTKRGAFESIASRLAPTVNQHQARSSGPLRKPLAASIVTIDSMKFSKKIRGVTSAPYQPMSAPEHTIMKRQVLLSIAFSVFAVNAFAATSAQPVVAEGGSDRLIESRVAEGGSDRLIENRIAEGGSDRLIQNRTV